MEKNMTGEQQKVKSLSEELLRLTIIRILEPDIKNRKLIDEEIEATKTSLDETGNKLSVPISIPVPIGITFQGNN